MMAFLLATNAIAYIFQMPFLGLIRCLRIAYKLLGHPDEISMTISQYLFCQNRIINPACRYYRNIYHFP